MIIAHEHSDRFSSDRHTLLPCEATGMEGYHQTEHKRRRQERLTGIRPLSGFAPNIQLCSDALRALSDTAQPPMAAAVSLQYL